MIRERAIGEGGKEPGLHRLTEPVKGPFGVLQPLKDILRGVMFPIVADFEAAFLDPLVDLGSGEGGRPGVIV